jgi:alpha-1,2-mannosyltransferase
VFGLAGVFGLLGVLGVLGLAGVFAVLGLAGVFTVLGEFAVFGVFAVLGVGAVFTVGATVPVVPVGDVPVDGVAAGVPPPDVGEAEDDAGGSGPGVSAVAIAAPPRTVKPRAPVTAQAAVERLIRMMRSFRWWIPLVDRCRLLQSMRVSPEGEPNESPLTRPSRSGGRCSSPGTSAGCIRTPPKPRAGARPRSSSEAPVVGTPRQTDAPRRDVIVVYGEAVQATTEQRSRIFVWATWIASALLLTLFGLQLLAWGGIWLDFSVYREAGATVLWGGDLYGKVVIDPISGARLPFTYPPFAALLAVPSALVPLQVAGSVWAAMQCIMCLLLAFALVREWPGWPTVAAELRVGVVAVSTAALLATLPVVQSIALGQASLAVVTLVVLDLTVVPRRWRGVLTGAAVAVKLTPLVFLVYFAFTSQWRLLAMASASAGIATAIAFVAMPSASVEYWTQLLSLTSRVGSVDHLANRSLLGLLYRIGLGGGLVWLGAALVIGVVALWRATAHHRRDEEVSAVLMIGMLSTVVSPIAWTHYLVWVSLAGVHLSLLGRAWPRLAGWALLVLMTSEVVFMSLTADDSLIRLAQASAGIVVAVVLCLLGFPERRRAPVMAPVRLPAPGPRPVALG